MEKNSDKEWWISPCVEGEARRACAFLKVKVYFIFTIFQFYSYNNNNSLSVVLQNLESLPEPVALVLATQRAESVSSLPIFISLAAGPPQVDALTYETYVAELLATRVWHNEAGPARCVWHSVVTAMVAGETLKQIYVYLSKSG